MATGMQGKTNIWIINSGATHHMTSNRNWLSSFMNVFLPKQVKIANGQGLDVLGHGDICLTKSLVLKEVLYVPGLECNLISVRKLMQDNNCLAVFSPSTCVFIPSSSCFQEKCMKEKVMREKIGCAKLSDGLFFLQPGSDECCFE